MNSKTTSLTTASFSPRAGAWLVFFVALAGYLFTAAPTIGPIDSGELSLVVKTLGIAHPTGYPLFTLLGKIWVTLMFWGDLAYRLNIFSAFTGAAAAALLFLILGQLGVRSLLSTAGSLLWAFSPVVWDQATVIEVYGLTSFFGLLLLWLSLKYKKENDFRLMALIAFLAGLGLGNHLILLWYLPGVVIIVGNKQLFVNWKKVTSLAGLFLLGVSVYMYLPLRSLNGPLLNWGDPSNWQRFLGHVTGQQYRIWMFNGSPTELWHNFIRFLEIAVGQPTVFISWLAVPGFIWLFLRNKRLLAALGTLTLATVFYAIYYSIPDISSYFLPALAGLSIASAAGLQLFFELLLNKTGAKVSVAFCGAAVIMALVVFTINWRQADRSRDHFTIEFANDILLSAGPDAVILTDNWDIYAPYLYLRHQQGIRPDVTMIDKELLRRSWYYRYLKSEYPDFYESCRPEIEAFLPQLDLFEHGKSYDPAQIQTRYMKMLNAMVLRNYYDKPAYLSRADGGGDYSQLAPGYERVPEGLLYRLKMPGSVVTFEADSLFCQRTKAIDSLKLSDRERFLFKTYPKMLYHRGVYLAQNMQYTEALPYFIKALEYDDRHPNIYIGLGGIYTGLNRVKDALAAFNKALELDPANQIARENIEKLSIFTPGGPKGYRMEIK